MESKRHSYDDKNRDVDYTLTRSRRRRSTWQTKGYKKYDYSKDFSRYERSYTYTKNDWNYKVDVDQDYQYNGSKDDYQQDYGYYNYDYGYDYDYDYDDDDEHSNYKNDRNYHVDKNGKQVKHSRDEENYNYYNTNYSANYDYQDDYNYNYNYNYKYNYDGCGIKTRNKSTRRNFQDYKYHDCYYFNNNNNNNIKHFEKNVYGKRRNCYYKQRNVANGPRLPIESFLPCGEGGAALLTLDELRIRKLFVDQIPLTVTSVLLYKKFLPFCIKRRENNYCSYIMEASIIPNRFRDRSRGYGFVTFSDPYSAKLALKNGVLFGNENENENDKNDSDEKENDGSSGRIKVFIAYAAQNPKPARRSYMTVHGQSGHRPMPSKHKIYDKKCTLSILTQNISKKRRNSDTIPTYRDPATFRTANIQHISPVDMDDDIDYEASGWPSPANFHRPSRMCPNEDIRRDFLAYTRIDNQELSKIVTSVEKKHESDPKNVNDETDENDERKDEIKESFDIENDINATNNDNSKSNKNATKCEITNGNGINITPLSEDYTLETPTTVAESVQNYNTTPSERISTTKKPGLSSTIENVTSIKHLNVSTPSKCKSKSSKSRLKYPRKPPMMTRKYKSSDYDLSPNTNGGHTSDSSGSAGGGSSGNSNSSRLSSSTHSSPSPNSHRNDKKSDENDEAEVAEVAEVAGGNTSVESICGEQKGLDSIITIDSEQGEREHECSKHEIVTPRRPKKPPLINTSNMLLHSYKLTRVNESPRKIFQTQPNSLRYDSEEDLNSTMNQEIKQEYENENDDINNNSGSNNNNGVNKTKSRNKYRNGIEYCHRWTTSKSILSKKNDIKPVDVVITSLARNSRTIDEFTDAPKLFDNKLNSKNSKKLEDSKQMENVNNNGDSKDGPRVRILETRTIYKKRVLKNNENLNDNNTNNYNKNDNVLTADMIENNIDSKFSFENSDAAVPYTLERYLVAHAQYVQSQTEMKQEMVAIPKIPPKIVPHDDKQSSQDHQDGEDNESDETDEYYPPLPK